ncbi:hypothetical protein [Nocardia sp. NBC_01388]|uniref:hypothetical protein n=1 Tax=Nocardia sp. NBC_01388 TaxID=2903596 RepID=UPI00324CD60A
MSATDIDLAEVRDAVQRFYDESEDGEQIAEITNVTEGTDTSGSWMFAMWLNTDGEVGIFQRRMTVSEVLGGPDIPWHERQYRQRMADKLARRERALASVEAGLPGVDAAAALRRLAEYLRRQIADDAAAEEDYANWAFGSPAPAPKRTTNDADRSGLELAMLILADETEGTNS